MQEQSWLFEIFYFCEYLQNFSAMLFVVADLFFFFLIWYLRSWPSKRHRAFEEFRHIILFWEK